MELIPVKKLGFVSCISLVNLEKFSDSINSTSYYRTTNEYAWVKSGSRHHGVPYRDSYA